MLAQSAVFLTEFASNVDTQSGPEVPWKQEVAVAHHRGGLSFFMSLEFLAS